MVQQLKCKPFKMKQLLLSLTLLLLMSSCISTRYYPFQKNGNTFKGKYNDHLKSDEVEVRSWYHYMVSKKSNGAYILRVFYPEKMQCTNEATYTSNKLQIKNGPATTWNDNGGKSSEGNYLNNKANGHWTYFHFENEKKRTEGNYIAGKEDGIWKSYDTKERLSSEITYIKGLKEGPFTSYDTLGTVINEGIYKADTIFRQTKEPETKRKGTEEMPQMLSCQNIEGKKERKICSDRALLMHVQRHIKYPKLAREYEIEGVAVIQFIIDEDGSVTNIKPLRGICRDIEKECIRVVKLLPKWKPGMQDGKAVKVSFNLPVRFKLT